MKTQMLRFGVVLLLLAPWALAQSGSPDSQKVTSAPIPPAAAQNLDNAKPRPPASANETVPVERGRDGRVTLTPEQRKELQSYDFVGAAQKLREGTVAPARPNLKRQNPAGSVVDDKVPAAWEPPHATLDATALGAADVSSQWMTAYNVPSPGPDGRVVYVFGAGMPAVVAAPLHVSIIELQAGEHINGQPQVGDSVRWEVSPIASGSGAEATPVLVVKPVAPGLETDLVVPTDRRMYIIRLISDPYKYVAHAAFKYPQDDDTKWAAFHAQQEAQKHEAEIVKQAQEEHDKKADVTEISENAFSNLFFDYKISGDKQLRPERVFDDGQHTYIILRKSGQFRELPTLLIQTKGKSELVNFRVQENRYVVDRLFNKAVLLVGVGHSAQKVTIKRGQNF